MTKYRIPTRVGRLGLHKLRTNVNRGCKAVTPIQGLGLGVGPVLRVFEDYTWELTMSFRVIPGRYLHDQVPNT